MADRQRGDGDVQYLEMTTTGPVTAPPGRTVKRASTAADSESWEAPRCGVRISYLSGGRIRQSVHSGDRLVIGSSSSADLVVKDRAISRLHCELVFGERAITIRDLNSRNGTRVNGVLLMPEAELMSGATLQIGATSFHVELDWDSVVPVTSEARFGDMVGHSAVMRAVFAQLEQVAKSEATVLIEGETGTGKELAAEAIHRNGPRRARPFIVVDCGAVSGELLASELFGHRKGAFTGAVNNRDGAFALADGGTLFLDEIGELSPELQPLLLRALERGQIKPVGGDAHRDVDVRVVAATNRDLRAEVSRGQFRADLYFRLAVVSVRLPPLRERLDDLSLLIESWVGELAGREETVDLLRSNRFHRDLARHRWPGNVRELRNYIERCLVLGHPVPFARASGAVKRHSPVDSRLPYREARARWMDRCEAQYVESLLRSAGDPVRAQEVSGLSRAQFYRVLRRHRIREQSEVAEVAGRGRSPRHTLSPEGDPEATKTGG